VKPAHMKLLRTIRLDPSDTVVFERAAEPGEWAVPGGFAFFDIEPATLRGKARVAFRSGFLGVATLGWSTLAQIVEASEDDLAGAIDALARQLLVRFGAPDVTVARSAAEEELAFAASLTGHPTGTLIAMQRVDDAGTIRETFRTLKPRTGARPARAFAFLEVDGEDEPGETIDLAALAKEPRRGVS
jgi:hypothetical protein